MTSWQDKKKKIDVPITSPTQCRANGCSLRASMSVNNSAWVCRYHGLNESNAWAAITRYLKQPEIVQLLNSPNFNDIDHTNLKQAITRLVKNLTF